MTRFDEFYAPYPRKKEPKKARRAYDKAVKEGAPEQAIIDGAVRYRSECIGKDPQFIKYPATWLNGGCWEDEPDAVVKPPEDLIWKNKAALAKSSWGKHHVTRQDAEELYHRKLITEEELAPWQR